MALHIQRFSKRFTTPSRILNPFMINAAIHVRDVHYCLFVQWRHSAVIQLTAGIYFLNASCWIYHCFDCSQDQKLEFTPTCTRLTAILCTFTELHSQLISISFICNLSKSSRDGSGGNSLNRIHVGVIFWIAYMYECLVAELLHDETQPCFLKLLILALRHVGNYVNIIHGNQDFREEQ